MTKIQRIILGSNNQKKYKELKELIDLNLSNQLEILSPKDFGLENHEIVESGSTFEENAFIKAKAFFEQSGVVSLSDDSGLIVDALDGEPGIYSARYAAHISKHDAEQNTTQNTTQNATDLDNIKYLLSRIKDLKSNIDFENLTAKFVTVLCLYDGKDEKYFRGEVHGKIIKELRGENGFGYDPIFVPNGYDKTFAELGNEIKNQISHRKNALDKFINYLR